VAYSNEVFCCMTLIPEDAKPALDMLRSVGGDEMLAMMMQTFLTFAEERLGKMVEESAAGNVTEVSGIAHSLKSSARQLGANALGDACAVTESAGRSGDATTALNGVKAIQREFVAARPWMQAIAKGAS
jgi:HPt (histidine-containing phosphotransfer) domain-containing protein